MTVDDRSFGKLEEKVDNACKLLASIDTRLRELELTDAGERRTRAIVNFCMSTGVAGITAWLVKAFA